MIKFKLFLILLTFCSFNADAFTLASSSLTAGWDTKKIAFDVNETSCSALGITAAKLNAAIDAAVIIWNKVSTTSLTIVKGAVSTGTTYADIPVIYCSNTISGSTIAVGAFQMLTDGTRPVRGSIEINGNSATNGYFGGINNATTEALVIAHEMGHVLGLGHSDKKEALMYYSAGVQTVVNISQDDADGMSWLYPRNEFSDGIMGCGTIQNVGGSIPPAGPGVMTNWFMLLAATYVMSRYRKFRLFR